MEEEKPLVKIIPAKKRGFTFFYQGRYLASKYDPLKEAERILENQSWQDCKVVIFLGVFPLYHLLYFLKKKLLGVKVFILSEDNFPLTSYEVIIKKIISLHSWRKDLLKSSFFYNSFYQAGKLGSILEKLTQQEIKKTIFIESPYLLEATRKSYKKIFNDWKNKQQKVLSTEKYFTLFWYLNTLKNLTKQISLIENIVVKGEKKTAVFVLSGPSLEKNLTLLKSLSRHLPVFTVAGITSLLLRKKIPITAIISVDAGYYNTYHFHWKKDTIPLILSLSSHPIISRRKNVFHFFDLMETFDYLLDNWNINPTNLIAMDASVTLTGVSVLEKLGFERVIMLGNDFTHHPFKAHTISNAVEEFAFSATKKTHTFENILYPLFKELALNEKNGFQDEKLVLYKKHFNLLKQKSTIEIIDGGADNFSSNFLPHSYPTKVLFPTNQKINFSPTIQKYLYPKVEKIIEKQIENPALRDLFFHRLNRFN